MSHRYWKETCHGGALTISGKSRERVFPHRDPFAPQLLHFSDCILKDRQPEPSG